MTLPIKIDIDVDAPEYSADTQHTLVWGELTSVLHVGAEVRWPSASGKVVAFDDREIIITTTDHNCLVIKRNGPPEEPTS